MGIEDDPNAGLSQDEIDAALKAAQEGIGRASASKPGADGDEAQLSQDDAALARNARDDRRRGEVAGGELTQADIDAALSELQASQGMGTKPTPAKDSRLDSVGRPFHDVAAAMAEPVDAERPSTSATAPPDAHLAEMPDFESQDLGLNADNQIGLLEDVELNVKIELGRTRMLVEDVLKLGESSVVELDKLAGDPVDVLVNDRLVARGEVLVLNDNFCVRINEIISQTGEAIRS
jgi:flagellar motor switch protein FliN/FliY